MGFFNRSKGGAQAGGAVQQVDDSLPDGEWLAGSEALFNQTVKQHYGSPETMAQGATQNYDVANYGTAMFFFRKSIDMLHSAYGFSQMQSRSPSPADEWIIDGFIDSLGKSLAAHPAAPVDGAVREVTHRLR